MKKRYLTIVFFILSFISYSNKTENELIDEVLIKIKRLQFFEAINQLNQQPLSEIKEPLIYLTQLIELNTYSKENEDSVKSLNYSILHEDAALYYLIEGYENLFVKNNRILAFESFSKGISEFYLNNGTEKNKALLLGLFKVINSGYSVPNEKFTEYLALYKNQIKSSTDEFWYHFFKIELFDLTTDYYDDKHERQEIYKTQLDSLNSLIPVIKNNKILYFIEKTNGDYYVKYDGDKALAHYSRSEVLLEKNKFFDVYRFRVKLNKSRALSRQGFQRHAIENLHKFKNLIAIGDSLTNALNYNFFLSEFYYKLGVPDSSNYYLRKVFQLEKKSDYVETNKLISELEVALETEKKEKQILKEQQRAETNRNWLIAAALALLLGTGIAILLQKNTSKKRLLAEQQVLLKQQRVENLLKEQELIGIDGMISGQEKERQRLANDLHDNLGSVLTSLKMHFQSLKQGLSDQEELEISEKTEALMEEAYQKVRSIAHIRNAGLKANEGLLPAVHGFAKKVSILDKLVVDVEEHGMTERLENSLEITIFRIIQELVTNVAKHANATECTVHLTNHKHTLNIMVEDNGKGFELAEVNKKDGMGLYSIQKRVENLDGQVTFDSIQNKGTSIIIDIPLA